MCLINETPVKPGKSIVGWKVFIKTPEGNLRGRYAGWDESPYEKGVVHTAVCSRGKRIYKEGYIGFHGLFTREAARDYAKGCGMNITDGRPVVCKCAFFDVISEGVAKTGVYTELIIPSFRANKMIIL